MKNLLIILSLFLGGITTLSAQRLDDHKFAHHYTRLPLTPLEGDFKTYSVDIEPGTLNLAKMGMIESSMKTSFFRLANFEYLESGGDFLIVVRLDGDHFVAKTLKKTEKTEGKGEDATTRTIYNYEVTFRIPITYKILDGKREVMRESIFSGYDRHFTRSFGEAGSVSALEKSWENAGNAQLEAWVKEEFSKQMNRLGGHLRSQFDTHPFKGSITFYGLKKAEKIGYQDFAAGVPALRDVVEAATPEEPLTAAAFGENIALWEAALRDAAPQDKKESVVFQAAAWNLAQVYRLTNDYENAKSMANRIMEPGRREYLFKNLLPDIEGYEARFVANQNVPNTYSTYDAEAAAAYAATQTAQRQPAAAPTAGPNLEGFVVLRSGTDTLRGVITDDYKIVRGTDGTKNLKGIYVEDRSNASNPKRYLEVGEFLYLQRGGVMLFPVFVGVGPLGIVTLQEPIYSTEGLVLSRMDESEAGDPDYSYWLIHAVTNRKGEVVKKVYGLEDGTAVFGINKFLAGKFEDCPVIMRKAENKEYETNGTSYRQIIDDYAECNGTEVRE